MKLRWLLLVLLACTTLAHAFDTYRVGSRLIRVGDSVSELIDLLGEPIYKEQVTTRFGGYVADKWQYRLRRQVAVPARRQGRAVHDQRRTHPAHRGNPRRAVVSTRCRRAA